MLYAPTAHWILATAAAVVGMVHVGGITRLTQSGLSMTSWSPLGGLPPLSHDEWTAEFQRYQTFPEGRQRQSSMTLQDFQYIYAWEYGHRLLGRTVGLLFVVPWAYFTWKRKIPPGYQKRMVGLLGMGGTQGLVGWWMVQSGLGEDRRDELREIRVRPQRLAAHLSMAVATYGALLWTGWDILGLSQDRVQQLGKEAIRHAQKIRMGSIHLTALTGLTIVSGALVAGNDAGRAYNSFPKMGDDWIPEEIWIDELGSRNFIENTATVQFNHRILGMSTAAGGFGLALLGLASPHKAALLTPQARTGLYAVGVAVTGQVTLGITTLLYYVPISLAAAHQLGSIVVFTSGLYLAHSLRYVRPALLRTAARNISTKSPAAGVVKQSPSP